MRLDDFRSLVRRISAEVPAEFFDGIAEVVVTPRTLPHPTRADVYTLGECIPIHGGSEPDGVHSRVVLYYGSFLALSQITEDFDWRQEAFDTLTHELRHHLEWRAQAPDLEAFDAAAEHNFARQEGDPFDPLFYLDGENPAEGVYQVDDDWFLDRVTTRIPERVEFSWHGRRYQAPVPAGATLPAFVRVVDGVVEPPPGDLVLVLRRKPRLSDLFRTAPPPFEGEAVASAIFQA